MSTALDITPAQRRSYLDGATRRKRKQPLTPEQEERREALLKAAREAASLLKSRFGARRVVLFGSLAHGAWFSDETDIDLAVEGMVPDRYWRAWSGVESLTPHTSVDLVELETCSSSLREAIQRTGVEL